MSSFFVLLKKVKPLHSIQLEQIYFLLILLFYFPVLLKKMLTLLNLRGMMKSRGKSRHFYTLILCREVMLMKKQILIIFSLVIFITTFSGCSFGEPKQVNDSITVYMDLLTYDSFNANINVFAQKHPEIKINIERMYGSTTVTEVPEDDSDSFENRLSTELMSGRGPDIIIMSRTFLERRDVYKMMASGVFEDLTPYIQRDKDFPTQELNMPLIESVKFNEKQLLIPLVYDMSSLVTTKATLEETGIDISDNKNFQDILKDMNGYIERAGNINNRRKVTRQSKTLMHYPALLQDSILDYENGKANIVNNKMFKEITELYKGIYQDEMITTGYQEDGTSATTTEFDTKHAVFSNMRSGYVNMLPFQGQIKKLNDKAIVTPLYSATGEKEFGGKITFAVAMNAGSQNKEITYQLIRHLLEVPQQELMITKSIPINKVCFKKTMPFYVRHCYVNKTIENPDGSVTYFKSSIGGKKEDYEEYFSEDLTQAEMDEYYNLTQSVTKGYFPTPQTDSEIWNDMEPYFKGEKSYQECAQALQDRLDIYMSE